MGILGPVIRAEVGDEIKVILLNRSPYPVSLYLQGVTFDKSQDGLLQKTPFSKEYFVKIIAMQYQAIFQNVSILYTHNSLKHNSIRNSAHMTSRL